MKDGDKYLLTYREDINCLVDESGEKVVFMGVKYMFLGKVDSIDKSGCVTDWSTGTLNDLKPYQGDIRIKELEKELDDVREQLIREQRLKDESCLPIHTTGLSEAEVIRIRLETLENLILKGLKAKEWDSTQ